MILYHSKSSKPSYEIYPTIDSKIRIEQIYSGPFRVLKVIHSHSLNTIKNKNDFYPYQNLNGFFVHVCIYIIYVYNLYVQKKSYLQLKNIWTVKYLLNNLYETYQ